MTNPEPKRPTDSELAILKVIWDIGPATVAQVHDVMTASKKTGFTTTQKLMQIMTAKGLLTAETSRRPFLYSGSESASAMKSKLVADFTDKVFDGSVSQLLQQAIGHDAVSEEELDALASYIRQKRRERTEQ